VPTASLTFASNGQTVAGRLEHPEARPRAWALFPHGLGGDVAERIARTLAAQGIGSLAFPVETADPALLIAASEVLAAAGHAPTLIIGHGAGGTAALDAAADIASVHAVATIAAPSRPDQAATIKALRKPLLILHAPFDRVVDIDDATRIFIAAHHPKSFVSLDHADHGLTGERDATYAAALIASWAARYLPPPDDIRDVGEPDVVAEETGAGRFQVAIRAGGIRFVADEPLAVGGLGSGPTPYDLLSAGLAACTTMTLRMYADQKGWTVGRIRTAAGHAKRGGTDIFSRRIEVDGDLDADQCARLLEIADRCPVHRTLEASARVETTGGPPPAKAEPIDAHMLAVGDAIA
jgi:uncharacterized OsmC-like protein